VVKIADFGLSRTFSVPFGKFTKDIASLWYRAPELMLGDEEYSIGVDLWAVGCILAEIILRHPIFLGDSHIDMLFRIFNVLGTPTDATYPGVSKLPYFKSTYPKFKGTGLESIIPVLDAAGMDLLKRLLAVNPNERSTACEAMKHPFFETVRNRFP
jgi:serine/threonine protein kinase